MATGCSLALSAAWASLGENAQRRSDYEATKSFVTRAEPGLNLALLVGLIALAALALVGREVG